jgi:glycosyltransferase involved in cell wall biosynthesis
LIKPKIVIVSIPEIEQVFASYIGAKLVRAKFIADIRDPAEDYVIMNTKGLSRKLYELMKRLNFAIYRKADAVATVTESLVKYLIKHGIKAILIPNGADTRIFRQHSEGQKIRGVLGLSDTDKAIVFNGHLGTYYRIDNFLMALAKVIKKKPGIKNRIKVVIIGSIDPVYAKIFTRIVRSFSIEKSIINLGMVESPERLAQVLSACDIGLIPRLSDPLFDYALPAKFYEYIACGLPVFAMARKGSELWKTVKQYGLGYVCQPEDLRCIAQALTDIVEGGRLEEFKMNILRMRRFVDREKGAKALYITIRSLIGRS